MRKSQFSYRVAKQTIRTFPKNQTEIPFNYSNDWIWPAKNPRYTPAPKTEKGHRTNRPGQYLINSRNGRNFTMHKWELKATDTWHFKRDEFSAPGSG